MKFGDYIDIVLSGLEDSSIDVKWAAAKVANKVGDKKLLLALKKHLNDKDKEIRKEAIISLPKITTLKRENIKILKNIIEDKREDNYFHLAALTSLMKIDSATAINIIKSRFKSKSPETKIEYVKILKLTNDPKAIDILLSCLERTEEKRLKEEAILSFGKYIKNKLVYSTLLNNLKNINLDQDLRSKILSIFVKTKTANIIPTLVKIINDKNDALRFEAIEGIVVFEPNISKAVLFNIIKNKKNNINLRVKALSVLSEINDSDVLKNILQLV